MRHITKRARHIIKKVRHIIKRARHIIKRAGELTRCPTPSHTVGPLDKRHDKSSFCCESDTIHSQSDAGTVLQSALSDNSADRLPVLLFPFSRYHLTCTVVRSA